MNYRFRFKHWNPPWWLQYRPRVQIAMMWSGDHGIMYFLNCAYFSWDVAPNHRNFPHGKFEACWNNALRHWFPHKEAVCCRFRQKNSDALSKIFIYWFAAREQGKLINCTKFASSIPSCFAQTKYFKIIAIHFINDLYQGCRILHGSDIPCTNSDVSLSGIHRGFNDRVLVSMQID